jgi:nucleoid-associated protein YgaU
MSLSNKYQPLIDAVKSKAQGQPKVNEQDNILYIDATVASESEKDNLWDIYNQIDPDYRAGDVRLNLVVSGTGGSQEYEVKSGDNLSKIGARYGVTWKEIYEANRDIIKNPDLIQPGWKLKIPSK